MRLKFSPHLKSRLTIGAGGLLLFLIFISLSQINGFEWIFVVALSGLVSVALFEFTSLCKKKDVFISFPILAITTILFFFSRYTAFIYPKLFFLPPLVLFCTAISFILSTFTIPQGSLSRLTHITFGFCFISFPLSWMIEIHSISPYWFIWLIATVKGGDITAYFIGKTTGRHLLTPSISPKKTVEGALATILGAGLIGILLSSPSLSLKTYFTLGSAMGTLAILGDLSESLIKRDANVKDSSTIPGLGGILDILDSLLFTTPCLYFYLKMMHLFY